MDRYVHCLMREAQQHQGQSLRSVYIGGGTPTLLKTRQLQELLQYIFRVFRCDGIQEVTIETNPETMDEEKADVLYGLGVNRVSLGAQTFHDKYLSFLGRNHQAAAAYKAFAMLRTRGFSNVNLDLMYSFPQESWDEIEYDLSCVFDLRCEHVSLYALTVEQRSRFYVRSVQPLPRSQEAEMYRRTYERLASNGYQPYEVSNFARPGYESVHNVNYWQGGDYIGLGVGAHSHNQGRRSWNLEKLNDYMSRVEQHQSPEAGHEVLSPLQRLKESLAFGLRMDRGVDISQLEEKYQIRLPDEVRMQINTFIKEGWLQQEQTVLRATGQGRLILDNMMPYLM